MILRIKTIIKKFKENRKLEEQNKELKKENDKLKETILKLDPQFKVLPFLKVLDIQNWKTEKGEVLPISMGYFNYSIDRIRGLTGNDITVREALYIVLRKITSEQMNELEARNFIYSFFLILELADEIPNMEVAFQKIIASRNGEAVLKCGVVR